MPYVFPDYDSFRSAVRAELISLGFGISETDAGFKVTSLNVYGGPTMLGSSDEFPGGAILMNAASVFKADDGYGTSIEITASDGVVKCRELDTTTL